MALFSLFFPAEQNCAFITLSDLISFIHLLWLSRALPQWAAKSVPFPLFSKPVLIVQISVKLIDILAMPPVSSCDLTGLNPRVGVDLRGSVLKLVSTAVLWCLYSLTEEVSGRLRELERPDLLHADGNA